MDTQEKKKAGIKYELLNKMGQKQNMDTSLFMKLV